MAKNQVQSFDHVFRHPAQNLWKVMRVRFPYKGKLCRILCEGHGPGPHNLLLEFEDGYKLVTIRRKKSIRKARTIDRQQELF